MIRSYQLDGDVNIEWGRNRRCSRTPELDLLETGRVNNCSKPGILAGFSVSRFTLRDSGGHRRDGVNRTGEK